MGEARQAVSLGRSSPHGASGLSRMASMLGMDRG